MSKESLLCRHCGKNILEHQGLIVFVRGMRLGKIVDVYGCCRGDCEAALKESRGGKEEIAFSIEVADVKEPWKFYEYAVGLMDRLYQGLKIDKAAYKKLREMMDAAAPQVFGWKEQDKYAK